MCNRLTHAIKWILLWKATIIVIWPRGCDADPCFVFHPTNPGTSADAYLSSCSLWLWFYYPFSHINPTESVSWSAFTSCCIIHSLTEFISAKKKNLSKRWVKSFRALASNTYRISRRGHDPEHIWAPPQPDKLDFKPIASTARQVINISKAAFSRYSWDRLCVQAHSLSRLPPLSLCCVFNLSIWVSNILSVCTYISIYEKCVFEGVYCMYGILEFVLVQIQSPFAAETRVSAGPRKLKIH